MSAPIDIPKNTKSSMFLVNENPARIYSSLTWKHYTIKLPEKSEMVLIANAKDVLFAVNFLGEAWKAGDTQHTFSEFPYWTKKPNISGIISTH